MALLGPATGCDLDRGLLAREQGFDARVFGNEDTARIWLRHGAG